MQTHRICNKCGIDKLADHFSPDKKGKLYSICKECKCAYQKNRYAADPEVRKKIREYDSTPKRREWARAHAAKKLATDPEYREKHRLNLAKYALTHDMAAAARERRAKPGVKQKISESRKIDYYKNKQDPLWIEQQRKKLAEYRKTDSYKAYKHRQYLKSKEKFTDQDRIMNIARKRIYRAMNGLIRADKMDNLIACTASDLKKHIESQFHNGMSWENRGNTGWHVDHILPCKTFDLRIEREQRICFHWLNLQPMWYYENCSKQDSLPENHIEIRKKIEAEIDSAS
jgi:hypothetical protein